MKPAEPMGPPVLAMTGGQVRLGNRIVLSEVDLRVDTGEMLAVVGSNGAGKSTLIRAMLGLVPLSAGRAEAFGTPLARFRQWWRIGYVPQRLPLGGGVPATVQEIVASGRIARRSRFRPASAADRDAVRRAIEAVDLADRTRDSVHELSGGQQQRVQIARALAGEPDVLVMDEPIAGVDAAGQARLADTLRRLGLTAVLALHGLGPLKPLVTRTVAVDDGRVAGHADRPVAGAGYERAG